MKFTLFNPIGFNRGEGARPEKKMLLATLLAAATLWLPSAAQAQVDNVYLKGGNGGTGGAGGNGGQAGLAGYISNVTGNPNLPAVPGDDQGGSAASSGGFLPSINNVSPRGAGGGGGGGNGGVNTGPGGNPGGSSLHLGAGNITDISSTPGEAGTGTAGGSGGQGAGLTFDGYTAKGGDGGTGSASGGGGGGGAVVGVSQQPTTSVYNNLSIVGGDQGASPDGGGGYGGSAAFFGKDKISLQGDMTMTGGNNGNQDYGQAYFRGGELSFISTSMSEFKLETSATKGKVITDIGSLTVTTSPLTSSSTLKLTLDGTEAGTGPGSNDGVYFDTIFLNGNDSVNRTLSINSQNGGAFGFRAFNVSGFNNVVNGNYTLDVTGGKELGFIISVDDINGKTMLDATARPITVDNSTLVRLYIEAPDWFEAAPGSVLTLIDGVNGTIDERQVTSEEYYFISGLTGVDFTVMTETAKLLAAYKGLNQISASGRSYKPYFEASAAGLMTLIESSRIMERSIDLSVAGTKPGDFTVNLNMQGGRYKNNTGSHIEADTFGAALSLARKFEASFGELTLGAFVEAGTGNYDTYNSIVTLGHLEGDGDAKYFGGGLFAHNAFANGFYAEGSFRGGSYKNDYKVKGHRGAAYDYSSSYWGAHLGLGRKFQVIEDGSVDLYGKVLWTQTEGDTVRNKDRSERIELEDADSLRTRLGARYTHQVDTTKLYFGAAWEHEFDGQADGRVNRIRVHDAPELKGSSVLAEAGLSLAPAENFSIDLGVFGVGGQQRGVGGTVGLRLQF